MKAKEFLNSHKLVVISDFIKSIEAIPEQKWLHDFMQNELAYLITLGKSWAEHDDDVPVNIIRSAAWLVAISKSYSGNYHGHPVVLVDNPSQIIKAWRERNDAKQYEATFKIAIDTSEAIAAVEILGKKIKDVINLLSTEDGIKIKKYELSHLTTRSMDKKMVEGIMQIVDKAAKHCIQENKNKISKATLCSVESSGSIEQQTLRTVLGNTLHNIPVSNVSSVAVELALAVKAAFDVLENKNATTR